MKKLRQLFETYLENTGQLDERAPLGTSAQPDGLEETSTDLEALRTGTRRLSEDLKIRLKFNDRIIILALALLVLLFIIGVGLVFYYRGTPTVMGSILGGTYLSLLSIVRWLYRLWREKTIMDLSKELCEILPPEKSAELITAIYWKIRAESEKL